MASRVAVLIEDGRTKCFASALDWPGWVRAGRDPELALDALELSRTRYAGVLEASSIAAPSGRLAVAASVPGDATTDFGAPSQTRELDVRALHATTRARSPRSSLRAGLASTRRPRRRQDRGPPRRGRGRLRASSG
ncbi:MAG TPA: hypothetical protein VMQ40_07980 [Acidimicrobiales bacterium]|nr:hypothetical protein [Acidimicrobiales bacterium]